MVGSPPPGRYPTKRDRRRQCNPVCKPSSSDARFALDPEREGRRYTSPLKKHTSRPRRPGPERWHPGPGAWGTCRSRIMRAQMTGTDCQGRPRGLARGNAAQGLIEMATSPFSVRSKFTQRHEALNHGLRRHKLRPSAKNVVSKTPKSFSVPLREKKFKKGNRPDMSPLRGSRWEGSGSGSRDAATM